MKDSRNKIKKGSLILIPSISAYGMCVSMEFHETLIYWFDKKEIMRYDPFLTLKSLTDGTYDWQIIA